MEEVHLLLITVFSESRPDVPELDLAFAISANARDAPDTFRKMKEVLKKIIGTLDNDKVHFSVIVYGSTATTPFRFGDRQPSIEAIRNIVDSLQRKTTGSALDKALVEVTEVFRVSSRPGARKILVIITDSRSTGNDREAETFAEGLRKDGMEIITVAVGTEADPKEFSNIASEKYFIVQRPKSSGSDDLADDILKRILNSESLLTVSFACAT